MTRADDFDTLRQRFPAPADDAVARLRHTVAWLTEHGPRRPDDDIVVQATTGLYPDQPCTGLTMGDLRELLTRVDAADVVDVNDGWPGRAQWPHTGGRDDAYWSLRPTVDMRRDAVLPGNVVHSSHGTRFQVARTRTAGSVTQLWADDSNQSERYDRALTIPVEVASLYHWQRPAQEYTP